MLTEKIREKLEFKKKQALYRDPKIIEKRTGKYIFINNKKLLNLSSNDYLGLGTNSKIQKEIANIFKTHNYTSSSSRLISGNYKIINEIEQEFAHFFGYEDCLFFPSGFQANLSLISSLFDNSDNVFYDKHVHASIINGMKLSHGNFFGFKHNSFSHYKKRSKNFINKVLVSESIFSMDGDFINEDFLNTDCFKIIDEAHAIGVLGKEGKGVTDSHTADVKIGTFGKAFGFNGAFILLPKIIKQFLINYAAPIIYTTNISPAQAKVFSLLLSRIKNMNNERNYLKKLSQYTKKALSTNGIANSGAHHIKAISIGNEDLAMKISQKLQTKGFFISAIRYPTVPINKAILRLSLNSLITKKNIDEFVKELLLT